MDDELLAQKVRLQVREQLGNAILELIDEPTGIANTDLDDMCAEHGVVMVKLVSFAAIQAAGDAIAFTVRELARDDNRTEAEGEALARLIFGRIVHEVLPGPSVTP